MSQHQTSRDFAEVMRDEMAFRDRIISILRQGAKTVPEIAESLGCPKHEAMMWVMALWRYGVLEATEKPSDQGYYQYQLKE